MDFDDLEFERLFAELTKRPHAGRWEPNTDVFIDEAHARVVVKVELAGGDAENLRVGVDERHLFIIGRRIDTTRFTRGSFLQKEIEYGDFIKKIHLPVAVEFATVSAIYGAGILTIELPIAATEYVPTTRTEIRMIVKRTLA
ncbi:MAG: Hsp20/alpha crystallin family protein [Candidatus Eremiobacteraeota bacterium]|nr:Hsp20/alpha crystallin family protein [Candidatus Eremiobacteraeota bacterium]